MTHILGLDDELDDGLPILIAANLDATDIGVIVGDHGGQLLEHTGAIITEDRDFHGIALGMSIRGFAAARPLDVNPAIALVQQILDVWTAARVDCHTLSTGYVADDLLAADGIAASRAIDKQIILALHLQ